MSFSEVLSDFAAFREFVKARNPDVKFVLTVSPVPLTATASGEHVLVATTYSKSVLRAVARELYATFDDVDYFPSYEIVAAPFSKGGFFAKDLRAVSPAGVEAVMSAFFRAHNIPEGQPADRPRRKDIVEAPDDPDDVVCEEKLLDAFAR